ncbi:MAG: hypothetical protein ACFFAO_01230 [Candidatus Hermodarchaeota archaeon]
MLPCGVYVRIISGAFKYLINKACRCSLTGKILDRSSKDGGSSPPVCIQLFGA